jgi:hypothetical protein
MQPSSSSPADKLFVERLDHILELVGELAGSYHHAKTLGRLSLVRRSWTALAQRMMLGQLHLKAHAVQDAVAAIERTRGGHVTECANLKCGPLSWKDEYLPEEEAAATLSTEARAVVELGKRCGRVRVLNLDGIPPLHLHPLTDSIAAFKSLRTLWFTSCEQHLGLGPTFDELR